MENKTEILKDIKCPGDVKNLDKKQLEILCQEIRDRIIGATSKNGGHVGPNLGVVELTVALHIAFDTPKDSFFWDVSHQGYVHKLLTGRNDDRFEKIRQSNGLSGFLSREESEHDAFGAGHAGTALSSALGRCIARDLSKKDDHVVAVAGDAAFTCGITLEALNNISSSTKRFILILNDNEWSIAKNVGAFSKYFNELITNPAYTRLHKDAESFLTQMPGGPSLMKFLSKAKRDTKELIAPSSIFEKMGIRYLGPIDGHDVQSLVRFFEFAKTSDEPIVLHLLTQKGKGFPVALEEPEKWHGSGPFDKDTGKSKSSSPNAPQKFQDVFGECLSNLAAKNENIVGITAAMPSGTGLDALHRAIPERFFDVGIAEEHAVLLAAGMATEGKLPVCAIYSTFLQRAYDPIIHDVCLQNLPVTFCLDRAGLSPNDGPTHHGLFDISYLRCVPNGIIMQPKDEDELQDMMATGITSGCPAFIRYPRGEGVGVKRKDIPVPLQIGKAEVLYKGSLCAIWAIGDFVQTALSIADRFKEKYGIQITVVNARFIKPLDVETLLEQVKTHQCIVTIEDNVLMGGFGSGILEEFEQNDITIPVKRFGWPDKFIEHGNSVEELRSKVGLDKESLYKSIEDFLSLKDQVATPIFA
ncbi:MAG: 1-deoxy-D-xylulose-5-phosphate synthase [Opitutae bacterium]|jgi:1-deoxy-D-xylulose-5-phosphate synthase|nr:1-deoxy-D-xylulose-5-phosphate synthase [Opitutae bacterium]MBT5715309.1 1-deoxy-D-xylulose-5-phosphate synthase [Opitutae bacterium]